MRLSQDTRFLRNRPAVAFDIMSPNPKSVSEDATVREIAQAMNRHGIYAAPVIDAAGRPKGVVTRTDVIEYWDDRRRNWLADESCGSQAPRQFLPGDDLTARDIMNPVVYCVRLNTPIDEVIDKMLDLEVRHVFVTDEQGILIGSISIFDALRHVLRDRSNGQSRQSRESFDDHSDWELPTAVRI